MVIIKTPPPETTDRLGVVRGLPSQARVDRQRHVIYGAALIQLGPLNEGDERPWIVDDVALSQVLTLAKAFADKGLKARWTHPNMSRDGMGTFLGRWLNPRIEGDAVVADLHISPLALKGDDSRGEYVEDLATEDPDAFGISLFPILDREAMQREQTPDGKQPMRFRKLIAGDVVDEPAATRGGFFGDKLNLVTLPAYATAALNEAFGSDATPDSIRSQTSAFLDGYLAHRTDLACTGDLEGDDDESAPPAESFEAMLAKATMAPSLPRVLPGGIAVANVEGGEAEQLAKVMPFVLEYLASVSVFTESGLSLKNYCDSRLTEIEGRSFDNKSRCQVSPSLSAALDKQTAIVERWHPLRSSNGLTL